MRIPVMHLIDRRIGSLQAFRACGYIDGSKDVQDTCTVAGSLHNNLVSCICRETFPFTLYDCGVLWLIEAWGHKTVELIELSRLRLLEGEVESFPILRVAAARLPSFSLVMRIISPRAPFPRNLLL